MKQEAKLEEIDKEIEKLAITSFRIGQKNFTFTPNDNIFNLASARVDKTKLADCYSCRIVTFQKESQMLFCQFCSYSNCKDCLTKTRPFPKAKLDNNGQKARGKICKYCDRKFLINSLLMEKHATIQKVKDLEHHTSEKLEEQGTEMKKIAYQTNRALWEIRDKLNETKAKHAEIQEQNTVLYMEANVLRQRKAMRLQA